jgi:hypothetical protein
VQFPLQIWQRPDQRLPLLLCPRCRTHEPRLLGSGREPSDRLSCVWLYARAWLLSSLAPFSQPSGSISFGGGRGEVPSRHLYLGPLSKRYRSQWAAEPVPLASLRERSSPTMGAPNRGAPAR